MATSGKESPCGKSVEVPKRKPNRPGLSRIDYRIGTQPEFLGHMLQRIPRQTVPDPESGSLLKPLAKLSSRETSDPTIALMDGFATTLDVLSFYSERIANEAYVGTASQRRSMVELARMIGYEPAPGVAASVHLAFSVEEADNPYRQVEVPVGVQSMSIPQVKGELPQLFETVEQITARAEWNNIAARTQHDQPLALYHNADQQDDELNGTLFLFDLDNSFADEVESNPELRVIEDAASLKAYYPLSRGLDLEARLRKLQVDKEYNTEIEARLRALPVNEIYLQGVGLGLKPGDRILATGVHPEKDASPNEKEKVAAIGMRVVKAAELREFGLTTVTLTRHGRTPDKPRLMPLLHLPKLPIGYLPRQIIPMTTESVRHHVREARWTGNSLSALVRSQSWSRIKLMTMIRKPAPPEAHSHSTTPGLHVMGEDCGFFGNSSPRWEALSDGKESRSASSNNIADPYPSPWDLPERTIWSDSQGTALNGDSDLYLEREVKNLTPDSWAIIESADGESMGFRINSVALQSRVDYAVSGKTTGLGLRNPDGTAVNTTGEGKDLRLNAFKFRSAHIYAASRNLPLSGIPIEESIPNGTEHIDLDTLYLDIERDQAISISGERSDAEGLNDSETSIISDVIHIGGITRLMLKSGLEYSYKRASVRINANVALATHGEQFSETLGSGSATEFNQTFFLARKPLTMVSAATESGRASTLEIHIDSIRWQEVDTLFHASPNDLAYEVRYEDDGRTRVRFGDGINGRRLPTGEQNITAHYRAGSGHAGEVADESIAQLKTRPLGIRSVINPSPPSGSAEPESLAGARLNAPQSVRSLGRIVSITDYEDFALGFAGVGKAKATVLWSSRGQTVHLTVAPENEAPLGADAPLIEYLGGAMEKQRNPICPLVIQPYLLGYFQIKAKLFIDDNYLFDSVVATAETLLCNRFGYGLRALGQPVSAAEIIAALHEVSGVVAVDLDSFGRFHDGIDPADMTHLESQLPARTAAPSQVTGDLLTPAELLVILPSAIALTPEAAHA